MRTRSGLIFSVFAATLLFSVSAAAQAERWQNDGAHSAAYFQVRYLGLDNIRGGFGKVTSVVMYDPKDVTKSTVEATVDVNSINTLVEARDKDLKGPNYFDTEKYPNMTFKSTSVQTAGAGKLKLTGDLTIRGVTKQVTFDVEGPTGPKTDDKGGVFMGATATATINRKDFGITVNPALGDMVPLTLELYLVKRAPAAPGSN